MLDIRFRITIYLVLGDTKSDNETSLQSCLRQMNENTSLVLVCRQHGAECFIGSIGIECSVLSAQGGGWLKLFLNNERSSSTNQVSIILLSGDQLAPSVVCEAERIFNQLPTVNWLTGYTTCKTTKGHFAKHKHHNQARYLSNAPLLDFEQAPLSGFMIRTSAIQKLMKAKQWNGSNSNLLWEEWLNSQDLYTTYQTTAFRQSCKENSSHTKGVEIKKLVANLWNLLFKRWFYLNIPYLRKLISIMFKCPPLINYDIYTDSYFFESFPPVRYGGR